MRLLLRDASRAPSLGLAMALWRHLRNGGLRRPHPRQSHKHSQYKVHEKHHDHEVPRTAEPCCRGVRHGSASVPNG
jgi:hypothetical protein